MNTFSLNRQYRNSNQLRYNYQKYQKPYIQKNYNSNYIYNEPDNNIELQNKITKSLYAYKDINQNKKNKSYKAPSMNNASYYSNYSDYSNFNKYDLIEDFRTTLMKTEQLTNQLMNKDNNFGRKNYLNKYNQYNNNIYQNITTNLNSKNSSSDENDLSDDDIDNSDLDDENEDFDADNNSSNEDIKK